MISLFRFMPATLPKAAGATAIAFTLGLSALGATSVAAEEIIVTIESVRALDKVDQITAGKADFFALATIDGKPVKSPVIKRSDDIKPNWVLSAPVGRGVFDVRLELFDKDVLSKDDPIDINRVDGKRHLDFQVDTRNCQVKGFSQGYSCRRAITRSGAEKKMAEIVFSVDVKK